MVEEWSSETEEYRIFLFYTIRSSIFLVDGIGFFDNKAVIPFSLFSLVLETFNQFLNSIFELIGQRIPFFKFRSALI
jgi:hypothetical protein